MIQFVKHTSSRKDERFNVSTLLRVMCELKLIKYIPSTVHMSPWWTKFYWESINESEN